jgi:hypothetical protein
MRRLLTPHLVLPKFSIGNYFLDSGSSLGVDSGSYLLNIIPQYAEMKTNSFSIAAGYLFDTSFHCCFSHSA